MSKKPEMMLVVEGDHNDADYLVSITPITEKQLEKFQPLIEAIEKFQLYKGFSASRLEWDHNCNWPCGEYGCRSDLGCKTITELYPEIDAEIVEEFDQEFVPHADGNIHTIEAIFVVKFDRSLYERVKR
jgi:hypothetical protein